MQDICSLSISMGHSHFWCGRCYGDDICILCLLHWGIIFIQVFSAHHFIPEFISKAFHLQSTGSFLATARYGSATPVPPSILSRSIGWLVCCNKCYFSYMVFFCVRVGKWVGGSLDHNGELLFIQVKMGRVGLCWPTNAFSCPFVR